jgi:hypothetical protein
MTFLASSPWLVELGMLHLRHQWRVRLNDVAVLGRSDIHLGKMFRGVKSTVAVPWLPVFWGTSAALGGNPSHHGDDLVH